MQHAYNILIGDTRNVRSHAFRIRIVAIGSKYADILRDNGKFQSALAVERVVERHQMQIGEPEGN